LRLRRLRELRLARGTSQTEPAGQAEVTTNYVSRREGEGAAPGIDLAARRAHALGVPVADLLPTEPNLDDLVGSEDRAVLLLTQVLTRLSKPGNARLRKALYLPALTAIRQAPHRLSTAMRRFRNGDGIQ
jgi:transcriptional regulator with XRE-family HTH domain